MKDNIFERKAIKVIAALLLFLMSIALIGSLKETPHLIFLSSNPRFVLALEIIGVFFLILIMKLLYTLIHHLKPKHYFIFSVMCLFLITLGQLLVMKYLEIRPIEDLNKVANMAVNLVNGKYFTNDNTYFSMYTNNIPFSIYLAKYFKICFRLGIRNYTLAGSILGILSINISIIFTSLILKELKNATSALFFLGFHVINPIVYLWGTFYYTTIVALPFMMLGIYLIIRLTRETHFLYFGLELSLLTVTVYIGTQIRATTSFVVIGALILILLKIPAWKNYIPSPQFILKAVCSILFSLFCLFIVMTAYNKSFDHSMQADYSETKFPVTHWVMMGLSGNGGFHWGDEQLTLSQPTEQGKIALTKAEIKTRIQDLGVTGLAKLIVDKIQYTWSDGSHDYPVIMRACNNYTGFHKYIIGEKRDAVILYFQIFHIAALLLVLVKMIFVIKDKHTSSGSLLYIVLFGGILFHIIWEANPKYSLNFIMLLLYIDSEAVEDIFHHSGVFDKITPMLYRIGGGAAILSTIIIAFLIQPLYTQRQITFNDLVQGQLVSHKDKICDICGDDFITQSFLTNRVFNHITLQIENESNRLDASYLLELLDENQTIIYSTLFSPKEKHQFETIDIGFSPVKPSKRSNYYIRISANSVTPDNAIVFCMCNKEGYDVFPHGTLSINNNEIPYGDLTFTVSNQVESSFTTNFSYVVFWVFTIFLETMIYIMVPKLSNKK